MQKKKQKNKRMNLGLFLQKAFWTGAFFGTGKGKFPKNQKKKKNFSAQKRKKRKKRHRAVLVSKFRNLGVDKSQPLLLRVQASLDHSSTRTRTTTVTTTLYPKKKN